jgi:hypothetical protein
MLRGIRNQSFTIIYRTLTNLAKKIKFRDLAGESDKTIFPYICDALTTSLFSFHPFVVVGY